MKYKIVLLIFIFTLLVLLPKTYSVSLSAKLTNTSQIIINNEPPYFFQSAKLNANSISFTIKKDCSNVTRTAQMKLSLNNFKSILTDVTKMTVNGSDVTSLFKKISNKWQRNFSNVELPCGMAYQIEIFYSKNELPVYNITFGETSSSLEVIVNTDITIDNGFGWWVINKDGGNPTSWYNLGYKYMYEGNLWEWTTDTEAGDASIFASSTTNVQCFANGNHSSFSTPVMTRVYCVKNGGTSTKDFTFYSNSNATDVRTFIDVGLLWRIGAQVTASGTWSNQCYGSATNSTPTAFGSLVKTYCGFWELTNGAKGSVAVLWKRNYTSYNNNYLSQVIPPYNFNIGRNASVVNELQSGTQEYVRYVITGFDVASASNSWSYIQQENSKWEDAPTITNRTGGCVNNYYEKKGIIGSADVFLCNPTTNVLNAEITPNSNTTKIWFDIQNFTSTDIFIYNSSGVPLSTDLWLRLKNYSGDWYYYNTTQPFLGCSGNYNNTKVNTGWICNNSGVQDYGTNKRLFLYFPVKNGTFVNFTITDTELTEEQPSTTTTTAPTTTTTTTTTIQQNCTGECVQTGEIGDYVDCDTCLGNLASCITVCGDQSPCQDSQYCFNIGPTQWWCGCCCAATTTTIAATTTTVATTTTAVLSPTTTTSTTYPETCSEDCNVLPIFPNGFESCDDCVYNLTESFGSCSIICENYGTVTCGNDLFCTPFEELYYCGCCCAPPPTPPVIGNYSVPSGCCPISEITCFDNQTLVQRWNISSWNNGSFFNISTAFIRCPFGCDLSTNTCKPAPINQYLIVGITFIIILILLGVFLRLFR